MVIGQLFIAMHLARNPVLYASLCDIERILGYQEINSFFLSLCLGLTRALIGDAFEHAFLQQFHRIKAELLCKFIIEFGMDHFAHIVDFDRELSSLARVVWVFVVTWVGEENLHILALHSTDQTIIKTWSGGFADHRAEHWIFGQSLGFTANHHIEIFAFHIVALLSCTVNRLMLCINVAQVRKFILNFHIANHYWRHCDASFFIASDGNGGIDFNSQLERDGSRLIVFEIVDMTTSHRNDIRLRKLIAHKVVNRHIYSFVTKCFAEALHDHLTRNLTRTETFELHFLAVFRNLLIVSWLQCILWDRHLEGADC